MNRNKQYILNALFLVLILVVSSCGNHQSEKDARSATSDISETFDGTSEAVSVTTLWNNRPDTTLIDTSSSMEVATQNLRTFENEKIEKVKKLDNGIAIKWLVDQKGRTIKDGEMVLIEYRLSLPDGKIVAGNNPNMPFMPFVVGYNMQTLGWDIALKELSVGDFAKIELPASFAYGSKGIKDVIPANSKVWLFVKIYSYIEPGLNKNGVKSWLVKQGEKMASDAQNTLEYTIQMTVSSKTRSNIVNTYFNNAPLMYTRGQRNLLPGLRNLVDSSRKGDRFLVLLAPEKGFGPNGFSDKISSQDTILVNMEIEDVRGI